MKDLAWIILLRRKNRFITFLLWLVILEAMIIGALVTAHAQEYLVRQHCKPNCQDKKSEKKSYPYRSFLIQSDSIWLYNVAKKEYSFKVNRKFRSHQYTVYEVKADTVFGWLLKTDEKFYPLTGEWQGAFILDLWNKEHIFYKYYSLIKKK